MRSINSGVQTRSAIARRSELARLYCTIKHRNKREGRERERADDAIFRPLYSAIFLHFFCRVARVCECWGRIGSGYARSFFLVLSKSRSTLLLLYTRRCNCRCNAVFCSLAYSVSTAIRALTAIRLTDSVVSFHFCQFVFHRCDSLFFYRIIVE